jgi:hypothetical protein
MTISECHFGFKPDYGNGFVIVILSRSAVKKGHTPPTVPVSVSKMSLFTLPNYLSPVAEGCRTLRDCSKFSVCASSNKPIKNG